MSCNGCRVLRKGCSETCILRPCLQWIETPEAQGHATVFVAKFFGRAGLMSFISAVPENQRPALFQSLLFEAAGRTVNPVSGAVGLLWSGNWQVCQVAVETVLRGGTLRAIPNLLSGSSDPDDASECTTEMFKLQQDFAGPANPGVGRSPNSKMMKRRRLSSSPDDQAKVMQLADLDLSLTPGFLQGGLTGRARGPFPEKRRPVSPSMNSEESGTTTCFESDFSGNQQQERGPKLLSLFN
ncbi:OLC1v1011482C1 [Oldenlandia corymbosa var. corymbosa]|uniref:OLC1v1011482C1 n=1 Tax=Oldenlandia corymbosa var. corymbosa TaxID=529605 RepID=A0AAV1DTY8_OLDCO|nr:OLC1v1011482C1 [Oldenlandia corymbosa var. corymbosa]